MPRIRILSDIKSYQNFPHIGWESEGVCRLVKPWAIDIEVDGNQYKIVIPNHVHSYDGLTARKIAAILQIEEGRSTPAWLFHDHAFIIKGDFFTVHLDREVVDLIFKEMLLELGYGPRRAHLAYLAVDFFGKKYWDAD